MKVYFHDSLPTDPRLPHTSPSLPAVPSTLLPTLGVLASHHPTLATVDDLARERSYANRDEITVSPEKMGAVYEDKIKMFFQEHLHEDEEIRYILDGAGYFDVRWGEGHRGREVVRDVLRKGKIDGEGEEKEGEGEGWVRIRLEKGDLIVLPAGIYHRFMVDEGDVGFPFLSIAAILFFPKVLLSLYEPEA
ncbi:1,2-dihydroxy-3-keto-5-methylthiopentene dioxygenase [Agyrium rufum]|nr:1,2-dihydroxy-3-keto-5-methylthiopentene dioxygenase [Agyrium rufum]